MSVHAKSPLLRILIRPGEVFSFWKLVGPCSAKRGYQRGACARTIDKRTGNEVERTLIRSNYAKVLYDTSNLTVREG